MAKIDSNELCPCGSREIFGNCHGPRVITNRPITISERVPLKVIPEPDPGFRSVLVKTTEGSRIIRARETTLALECGQCRAPLVVGLRKEQIRNVVLKCNQREAFNDTE